MQNIRPSQLKSLLLEAATRRPVMIHGPPGIGKSAIVGEFAEEVGLPIVTCLGTQLAPEDLIGVPQIVERNGTAFSRFCPPEHIAREEPYVLFLDELNGASQEVQKAFYSLIHDRRLGNYRLHPDAVVIAAGNRAQDMAITKPMSSALVNRMFHVELRADHRDWLAWAREHGLHLHVIDYVTTRPDHLFVQPPKVQEPFSTPRSWHLLSDLLYAAGEPDLEMVELLALGCLSGQHALQFKSFVAMQLEKYNVEKMIAGDMPLPKDVTQRDLLYFLTGAIRAHLIKRLPHEAEQKELVRELVHNGKRVLREIASISEELGAIFVSPDDQGNQLPRWFLIEVIRDLPRLGQAARIS